jgi:hypothetical protein
MSSPVHQFDDDIQYIIYTTPAIPSPPELISGRYNQSSFNLMFYQNKYK